MIYPPTMSDPRTIRKEMDEAHELAVKSDHKPPNLDLTNLYIKRNWGDLPAPVPPAGLRELQLVDVTSDPRWSTQIKGSRLGLYRTNAGAHWLLRYHASFGEHQLEYVGTELTCNERFSK